MVRVNSLACPYNLILHAGQTAPARWVPLLVYPQALEERIQLHGWWLFFYLNLSEKSLSLACLEWRGKEAHPPPPPALLESHQQLVSITVFVSVKTMGCLSFQMQICICAFKTSIRFVKLVLSLKMSWAVNNCTASSFCFCDVFLVNRAPDGLFQCRNVFSWVMISLH